MSLPKPRRIAAEDLYRMELVATPRFSPDGRKVVYAVQSVDRETERKLSHLWLVDVASGHARQFTHGSRRDTDPAWSPDGRTIAFLSTRGGDPAQIYLISGGGGEAHRLSDILGSISGLSWSPDGARLLCVVRKLDQGELERRRDERARRLGVVYRSYTRMYYKRDGIGYDTGERSHLWVVEAATGRATQLTDHVVYDETDPAWSPDGTHIVYVSNRSRDPDLQPDRVDLFLLGLAGGAPRRLETPVGPKSLPSFSPDGQWLAYLGVEGEGQRYRNAGLWVVPVDGSAAAQNLTEPHDLHARPFGAGDTLNPAPAAPVWSADGQRIWFLHAYRGRAPLAVISRSGAGLIDVIPGQGSVAAFSLSRDGAHVAYVACDFDLPGQVRLLDVAGGQDRRLSDHNRWLGEVDLGRTEEAWIKGCDGNDIHGWIHTPPGFDPGRKYPSILQIHGGPASQYESAFMHEFHFLAAHDYVVAYCNPRGGVGYGQAHLEAIRNRWGGPDYADVMAWRDYTASLPYVDAERMGVGGGSYGGWMTLMLIGQTDCFRAAVADRCVSNNISLFGTYDRSWIEIYKLNNKPPWDDLQAYWDISPMKYIGHVKTPTMVIHSEMDLASAIEQGEQVYTALKWLGVDTEMVRFPEEFHGLSRSGRTDRRVQRLLSMLRWYDRYLQPESGSGAPSRGSSGSPSPHSD